MKEELKKLVTTSVEPDSLWNKRLVLHYEGHVQLLAVLDLAERNVMVRRIAASDPFESLDKARWEKLEKQSVFWIDLDRLIGVKRLQVFPRPPTDPRLE